MSARGCQPSSGLPCTRHDDGFTLIELVLSIGILGLIMSSIVGSLFVMLQTKKSTLMQLDVSHDAQNASSYLNNDAQGGTTLTLGSAAGCGSTATALMTFTGNDYIPTASPNPSPSLGAAANSSRVLLTTSWVWLPDAVPPPPGRASGQGQLQRISCRTPGAVVTSVVAHDLKAVPAVGSSCDGTAPASTSAPVVSLSLVGTDNLSVVLCAQRRTA